MNLTIYVDVLFLLNFILDYFILCSTALFSGSKLNNKRIIIASVAGAIYSIIIFFPEIKILNVIFFKFVAGFLMSVIAFKWDGIVRHLKLLIIYYVINTIYGGGIYMFYNFTVLGSKMNYSNGVFYISMPLWNIITLTFVFYFAVRLIIKFSNSREIQKNISDIEIHFNGTKINVNALFDTGNSLYDPLSLMPVMLIELNILTRKISDVIYKEIENPNSGSLDLIHKTYPKLKFRIIPFKDVTGKTTFIFAFKPDKIVNVENGQELQDMLIGIVNTKFCEDNTYNALLHSKS